MIDNFQTERYDFRKVYGSGIVLPDSRLKFLDTETKESSASFVDKMSTYVHRQANDPSMALYRVREHVRNKVPFIVEKDRILQRHEKKIEKILYDVKYANIALQVNVKSNRKVKKLNEMLNYLVFKSTKTGRNPFNEDSEDDNNEENFGELVSDDYIGGLVSDLPMSDSNSLNRKSPPKDDDDFDFVAKSFDDEDEEEEVDKVDTHSDDFKPKDFSYSDSEGVVDAGSGGKTQNQSASNDNDNEKIQYGEYYISDSEEDESSSELEETMESYLPMDDIPKEVVIAEEENFYVPTSIGESSRASKSFDEESKSIIDRFVTREIDGDNEQATNNPSQTENSKVAKEMKKKNAEEEEILAISRKVKKRTMKRRKRKSSNTENAESIIKSLTSQPIHLEGSGGIVIQSFNKKKKSRRKRKKKRKKRSALIEPPKEEKMEQNSNVEDDFKPAKFDF